MSDTDKAMNDKEGHVSKWNASFLYLAFNMSLVANYLVKIAIRYIPIKSLYYINKFVSLKYISYDWLDSNMLYNLYSGYWH